MLRSASTPRAGPPGGGQGRDPPRSLRLVEYALHHRRTALRRVSEPADLELGPLGPAITMKPAHGGGGDAPSCWAPRRNRCSDATAVPDDSYLRKLSWCRRNLGGRLAWFRVIYAAGYVYPFCGYAHARLYAGECWRGEWFRCGHCRRHARIAETAALAVLDRDFRQADGDFKVVDYERPADLRSQSVTPNGVPDQILGFAETSPTDRGPPPGLAGQQPVAEGGRRRRNQASWPYPTDGQPTSPLPRAACRPASAAGGGRSVVRAEGPYGYVLRALTRAGKPCDRRP
jgi:hypothetical protein